MPSLGLKASLKASSGSVGGGLVTTAVRYLARENGQATDLNANTVRSWSNPLVAKTINTATNRYGASGYYQIRPGPSDIGEAVADGNDLGITAALQPTLYSHPSFATVSGYKGSFVNYGGSPGYPDFVQNDGVTSIRQGALSIPIDQGNNGQPYAMPVGTGFYGNACNITMTQTATFLLGVAVDAVSDRTYAPKYVSVFSTSTGTVFSASIPTGAGTTGVPRLPVFLVAGKAGDVFTVGLWQNSGANSVAPFSLITFDRIV